MSRPERKNGYQKKRVDKSGLGKAIINRRKKQAVIDADPTLHTSEIAAGLRSVTEENDLTEFLSTAQLAETDFSAERQNIKVVSDPSLTAASHNPYLLTPQQEQQLRDKQGENAERLQVPRRPAWNRQMTVLELERRERDAFLEWRRGLAELQDNQSLLLTPFERNLEVWRQLWRTCERSDLIVQIVDARNPLQSRSVDLEKYVQELNIDIPGNEEAHVSGDEEEQGEEAGVEGEKKDEKPKHRTIRRKNLLLINKSDMLTLKQRQGWADYFEKEGIQYAFFSAANGIALQEERARREEYERWEAAQLSGSESETDDDDEDPEVDLAQEAELSMMKVPKSGNKLRQHRYSGKGQAPPTLESDSEEEYDSDDELAQRMERGMGISHPGSDEHARTRILSVLELEDLFLSQAPEVSVAHGHSPERMVVGLVGYPNVGKSSTINALIGEKKVSVSSTPGKTKHFQTIRLSPDVLLCDCPGLVFPQFSATKADLVCDGVMPIDQMREHTGPVELITRRIPQSVLEGIYGLKIVTVPVSEGGTGIPTAREFLTTYGIARGYFTGGMGNVDTSKTSRVILKDYVNGKLLYCHPPPAITADEFNAELHDLDLLREQGKLATKQAPTTRVPLKADTYIPQAGEQGAVAASSKTRTSARAQALDRNFFGANVPGQVGVKGVAGTLNGDQFKRVQHFAHLGKLDEKGNPIVQPKSRRKKQQAPSALLTGQAGEDAAGKKHFKPRRQKQRSGRGYDD